jgi:hypothetical protein
MLTDGQTVMTKLIVAFRNFAEDPKNCTLFKYGKPQCNIQNTSVTSSVLFLPWVFLIVI